MPSDIIRPGAEQAKGLAKIEPRNDLGVCPYLPPSPVINKLTNQVEGGALSPCLGEACALFNNCHGKYSPKASEERRISIMKSFKGLITSLKQSAQDAHTRSIMEGAEAALNAALDGFPSQPEGHS